MIQRGDLLRVPYTGHIVGFWGYILLYGFQFAFVLSSTLYLLFGHVYIYISFMFCFNLLVPCCKIQ